jgi:hypothetical protein
MRKRTDPPKEAIPDPESFAIEPAYARGILFVVFLPILAVFALHFELKHLLITGHLTGYTYVRESLYGNIGFLLSLILGGGATFAFHSAIVRHARMGSPDSVPPPGRLWASIFLVTGAALWLVLNLVHSWIVGPVTYIPVNFERLGREVLPILAILLVLFLTPLGAGRAKKNKG